jgi:hypothetical protein
MAAQTTAELILLIEEDREILELLKSNPDHACPVLTTTATVG